MCSALLYDACLAQQLEVGTVAGLLDSSGELLAYLPT
jgi:hypothetical protein